MLLSETCKLIAWDSIPSMGAVVLILQHVLSFKYLSDVIKVKVKIHFSPA